MAEDLSVTAVSGRKHPRAPTQQMQQQLLPPDASALSTFASESPVQPPQQSDGLARTAASSTYTVSLLVSAAGEKHDLQVIGTDRNPLLLEGIDTKETYNIQYGYSKTGWQVAQTTVSMLKSLNVLAKERKRTFRVILDSAVPHVKAAMILDSQGDQRTFSSFKARFRSEMVETLFNNYRQSLMNQDPRGFHPQRHLHTRNIFHWFYGLLPTQAIASLNLRIILSNSANVSSPSSGTDSGNGSAHSDATGIYGVSPTGSVNGAGSSLVANGSSPSPALLYRELQHQLTSIAQLAPDFLRWIGVTEPANAQAFVDLEGNASVTDPGIDEVQIIRGVLQKHGYLSTKRLDDESHANGPYETFEDVADEPCPRPEEVLASIGILKRYLRLSRDAIPSRVDAIVQLNQVKRAVDAALFVTPLFECKCYILLALVFIITVVVQLQKKQN
ncbi:hypothetical protein GQ600_17493 [Phytophthora cactorum]|nr:hypothetical protein GQ600_17493 [Phytophthora cactorum]